VKSVLPSYVVVKLCLPAASFEVENGGGDSASAVASKSRANPRQTAMRAPFTYFLKEWSRAIFKESRSR